MKKKMQKVLPLLLLQALLLSVSLSAQKTNIRDLQPLFNRLKSLRAYSFENHTKAVFDNGQADQLMTRVYMDKTNESLFYENRAETVLLNKRWIYKADHLNKYVQIFNLAAYKKREKDGSQNLSMVFQYDMSAMFLDSVVMKYGILKGVEKKGNLTTYKVGFAPDAAYKQIVIIYDETTMLPQSIYFRTSFSESGSKRETEVLYNNYKAVIPAEVFNERAFFTVAGKQLNLLKNKNYKVYSLL